MSSVQNLPPAQTSVITGGVTSQWRIYLNGVTGQTWSFVLAINVKLNYIKRWKNF